MADQFNILDYTEGPLLKSGQTTDRTPAGRTTKDDGGFQRGIAGSKNDDQYVILTTGQYNGNTTITVNGINDAHTNACVFDKVTGLMWSREASPSIYGIGTEELAWDDSAGSNEDIFEYCDQANNSGLAGYSDWRVPNHPELLSIPIFDFGNAQPNSTAWPVSLPVGVWTSTTRANVASSAYVLNTSTGIMTFASKSNRQSVLLVRMGIE